MQLSDFPMERRIKREQKVNDGDCKKHDEREIAYVLEDEMCGGKFWAQMFGLCVRETRRESKGKISTDSHGYMRWAASCLQISCLAQIRIFMQSVLNAQRSNRANGQKWTSLYSYKWVSSILRSPGPDLRKLYWMCTCSAL